MRVVIVPEAAAQIREVDGWWRSNRPASPELFAEEMREAVALISAWPLIGRRCKDAAIPGLRRILLRATRYHAYYTASDPEKVFILAVWSAIRGRGPMLRRPG